MQTVEVAEELFTQAVCTWGSGFKYNDAFWFNIFLSQMTLIFELHVLQRRQLISSTEEFANQEIRLEQIRGGQKPCC